MKNVNLSDIKMSVHMLARTFFESLHVTVKSGETDLSYRCLCNNDLSSCHVWKWVTQSNLPDMTLNYENLEASECTDPDFKLFYEWLQGTIRSMELKSKKRDAELEANDAEQ